MTNYKNHINSSEEQRHQELIKRELFRLINKNYNEIRGIVYTFYDQLCDSDQLVLQQAVDITDVKNVNNFDLVLKIFFARKLKIELDKISSIAKGVLTGSTYIQALAGLNIKISNLDIINLMKDVVQFSRTGDTNNEDTKKIFKEGFIDYEYPINFDIHLNIPFFVFLSNVLPKAILSPINEEQEPLFGVTQSINKEILSTVNTKEISDKSENNLFIKKNPQFIIESFNSNSKLCSSTLCCQFNEGVVSSLDILRVMSYEKRDISLHKQKIRNSLEENMMSLNSISFFSFLHFLHNKKNNVFIMRNNDDLHTIGGQIWSCDFYDNGFSTPTEQLCFDKKLRVILKEDCICASDEEKTNNNHSILLLDDKKLSLQISNIGNILYSAETTIIPITIESIKFLMDQGITHGLVRYFEIMGVYIKNNNTYDEKYLFKKPLVNTFLKNIQNSLGQSIGYVNSYKKLNNMNHLYNDDKLFQAQLMSILGEVSDVNINRYFFKVKEHYSLYDFKRLQSLIDNYYQV